MPATRTSSISLRALAGLALATVLVWPAVAQQPPAPPLGPGAFDALPYRHIGPVGNRVSAVAGVPGNPAIIYFGAASGGVF